jgi:hypothetical protein
VRAKSAPRIAVSRTRKDPFAEVWPVLLNWLEERPDLEAKELLKRLQASNYDTYPDNQLRTLQRRVRIWHTRIARELVYGNVEKQAEVMDGVVASQIMEATK